jgi:hypothetical protein
MADDDAGARQWIVEPPAPGEVTFHMSIGEDVELTEDQERALSVFVKSLETADAEVTGHSSRCSAYSSCNDKTCKPVKCNVFDCTKMTSTLTAASGGGWSLMGSFTQAL